MFKRMVEGYRAWRRGDKRVAPYGTRGRVFVRKDEEQASTPGNAHAKARGKATLEIKVTRADGTVETHQVPASVEAITE